MRFSLRQLVDLVTAVAIICGVVAYFVHERQRSLAIFAEQLELGRQLQRKTDPQMLALADRFGSYSSPTIAHGVFPIANSDGQLRIYVCQKDSSHKIGYGQLGSGLDGKHWEFWILDRDDCVVCFAQIKKEVIVKTFSAVRIDDQTVRVTYHLLDQSVSSIDLELFAQPSAFAQAAK